MNHIKTEHENNIAIELPQVSNGERVCVTYTGLLNNKGSNDVYLHYGFDGWKNTSTVPMYKRSDGSFSTDIKVNGGHEVNLCFKDGANNWDNNNGTNWRVEIK